MRCRGLCVLFLLGAAATWGSTAQAQQQSEQDQRIKSLAADLVAEKKKVAVDAERGIRLQFSVQLRADLFATALSQQRSQLESTLRTNLLAEDQKAEADYTKALEDARTDEQVGGSDASAGSTSLVSKGSVPAILGFAVENGALSRSVSGTTMTFRGNLVGIIEALQEEGFNASYEDRRETAFFRRLSFALSFDTSRGTMPGVFTGDQQQLSSYSFRCDIINARDPRNRKYRKQWTALITNQGQALTVVTNQVMLMLYQDPAFQNWQRAAQNRLIAAAVSEAELDRIVREEIQALQNLPLQPDLRQTVEQYASAYKAYLADRQKILDDVSRGLIVTFDYTNIRELQAPDLSNFKLIAEGSLYGGRVDLTSNFSLTIHNAIPQGTSLRRVRDFQLSGQIDVPLGEVQKVGSVLLTFSGKYERMMENAMMGGMMVPDTKGDIGIGQIKLTIPVKGSGVKIPLSITFANRTELIKEKEVRGNIGITFDLDSIFARLKP